jgi:hypothetical protein
LTLRIDSLSSPNAPVASCALIKSGPRSTRVQARPPRAGLDGENGVLAQRVRALGIGYHRQDKSLQSAGHRAIFKPSLPCSFVAPSRRNRRLRAGPSVVTFGNKCDSLEIDATESFGRSSHARPTEPRT